MIIRTFKATIHPGKNEEFKTFFTQIAIPLVRKQEGLVDFVYWTANGRDVK